MKLAILGGSFNPVHIGHLLLADAVLSGLDYDRVILIPAFQSPFKINAGGASPRDRMEMLAASVAADPRLAFDDCELNRGGVSYTIDTLVDVIERYRPEGKPGLIMGDDLAATFDKWRKPDEIAELADFIIARREGWGAPEQGSLELRSTELRSAGSFPYPYRVLNNEIVNVSSRMVREKIGRGGAWRYFVPSGARRIIEDKGLYGFSGPRAGESPASERGGLWETIERIELDVRTGLDFGRFIHSRNTALLSWDLCRSYGLEGQKGYLAGIAHDICKDLEEKELMRLARADGGIISKLEQKKPGLLHGRAAAVLLRRKYNITDKDILEAIRYHTTGSRDMSSLAKIVYVADKLEISRTGVDPALKNVGASDDLDDLFAAVVGNTVTYLKSRQLDISLSTKRLLAAMQRETAGLRSGIPRAKPGEDKP